MKNSVLCGLLSLFVLVSCKKEEEKSQEAAKIPVFTATVNATVEKDDTFQIFFKDNTDPSTQFEEANSVYATVKGSKEPQDIVFNFPEGVEPVAFRFDLGYNKEQTPIKINSFKVAYDGKQFGISGNELFNYFRADTTFSKIDKATGTVTPFVTKDGVYDPMIFNEENYSQELVKLAR